MTNYVNWPGASGQNYAMELREPGRPFVASPGVYIFCRLDGPAANWVQIYVGETEDFNDRLNVNLQTHHCLDCIAREGATHVCVLAIDEGKTARLAVETDLRDAGDPPCNRLC
jgi:hypothetical protein